MLDNNNFDKSSRDFYDTATPRTEEKERIHNAEVQAGWAKNHRVAEAKKEREEYEEMMNRINAANGGRLPDQRDNGE